MVGPFKFAIQNTTPIKWLDGTNFNGFLRFTLNLPTGYSGKARLLNNINADMIAPEVFQLWIRDGLYAPNHGFWSNSSINPSGTSYTWEWYDASGSHLTQFDNSGTPQDINLLNSWNFTTSNGDFTINDINYDIIGSFLIPTGNLRVIPTASFV